MVQKTVNVMLFIIMLYVIVVSIELNKLHIRNMFLIISFDKLFSPLFFFFFSFALKHLLFPYL